MRIRSFQNEKKNQYYFRVFDASDDQVLRSEAYETTAGRDNGIESFKKNAPFPERYEHLTSSDGKFYFNVKAANHQIVATSLMFDSEEKRESVIAEIIAFTFSTDGGDSTVSEVQHLSFSPNPNDGEKEQDDYHDLSFYEDSGTDIESGFDRFQKGVNNYHYFSFKSDDGKVLLLSQGYTAEAGRENGIASVEKNASIEKRYSNHNEDGKFYFTLKAGNHQEIVRSCDFDTVAKMKRAMAILMNGGGAMLEPEVIKAAPKSSGEDMDDYRTFGFYKNSGTDVQNGWDRFYSDKHNEYYFSYKVDGEPVLISEGYTTEAARENGIASVEKNWSIDKRYKNHKTAGGRYYYTIRSGNNQEITRSNWYSSAEERDGGVSWLLAGGLAAMAASNLATSAPPEENVIEKTIETVPENDDEKEDEKVALPISGAITATAVAAAIVTDADPSADPDVPVDPEAPKENDYLSCKEYEGHELNDKVNNIAFFKHENGLFYFAIYKEDGSVRLRSEGFEDAKTRDVELSGVLKDLDNPDMYETHSRGKYRIHVLSDATGKEVGRSCLETIVEKAAAPPVVPATALAAAAIAGIAPDPESEPIAVVEPDKEDDYLLCQEYENHKINDKKNNVAFFKHEDDQYYFVIYKSDGTVRLRSEGFRTIGERDSELSDALKHLENAEMYETVTKGKYSLHILRDETGREVGRSCLETESNPLAVPILAAAIIASAAVIPDIIPPILVEEEVIVPVVPVVVEKAAIATPRPVVAAAVAESGAGGFNWKLWLPIILLGLLALFLFMKSCDGCGNKATTTPPVKVDPTPIPDVTKEKEKDPVPVSKEVPVPVPVPDPVSCNCTGSSNIIFNIPSNQTPKVLTRLGRNPEFGNSHGLEPAGFFNKLKNAHASNNRDKKFLDNLFKAMGYSEGFAGAKPGLISHAKIAKGTIGNMGQGPKHRTNYAQLNASGKDLEAFKIKAANGCDIHFMKTCGNHFFFCSK